jgi:tetratricopeptide (TPR) repeat protein
LSGVSSCRRANDFMSPSLTLRLGVCSGLPARAVVVGLACLATVLGGCRIMRSRKTSDEGVAAARQLSLQGMDAQQRGQWERAETFFATAILRCPGDERARFGYAETLWHRGDWETAIVQMEEAVRLSGRDPARVVRLGQMYVARGDYARAGRQADSAIATNDQMAAAWALKGRVQAAQGERTAALSSYHRALVHEQPLADVRLAIAQIYAEEGRPQRALATVQSLAATYPPGQMPPEVALQEGLALRALGRNQDSARVLAAAANRGAPVDLLVELARSQDLAGDRTGARQTLNNALRVAPGHEKCLALLNAFAASESSVATAAASLP